MAEEKVIDVEVKSTPEGEGNKDGFMCSLCGAKLKSNKEYNKHIKQHNETFKCEICEKAFSSKHNMVRHGYENHRNVYLKCDICDIMFNKVTDMNLHQKFHTKESPYLCMLCLKSFKNLNNLRDHYNNHERLVAEAIKSKTILDSDVSDLDDNITNGLEVGATKIDTKSTANKLMCDICGRTFLLQHNLLTHSLVHAPKGSYKCEFCDEVFDLKHKLVRHESTHEDKIALRRRKKKKARRAKAANTPKIRPLCHTCGKSFCDDRHLRRHREFHLPKGHFPCKLCDKSFDLNIKLKVHMMYHRRKAKSILATEGTGQPGVYPCNICGKVFEFLNSLNAHKQLHITSLVCDFCGKVFNKKWNLKTHLSIHLGYKPHSCSYCGASYTDKSNLKKHLMKHPTELGAKAIETKISFDSNPLSVDD